MYKYMLLHDWEGNMGREGRYRNSEQNISPYCPTVGIAVIDLLYNFRVTIDTGNNVVTL